MKPSPDLSSESAFVGFDVAIAKGKRLPVVACVRTGDEVRPLELNRPGVPKPPAGPGNAAIIERTVRREFARITADYLRAIEEQFGVRIRRIAIDAPSSPKLEGRNLREAEAALGREGISYIQTPSRSAFEAMPERVGRHLKEGGTPAKIPCANQLWMLFGFDLFDELTCAGWECLEVYPQATVRALGVGDVHKSKDGAVLAQMKAASLHTGWPKAPALTDLKPIAYGSGHDRLDAYLAAWVASLEEHERKAIGKPPDDVIWVPTT